MAPFTRVARGSAPILSVTLLLASLGCAKARHDVVGQVRCESWKADIGPVFAARCSSCHATTGVAPPAPPYPRRDALRKVPVRRRAARLTGQHDDRPTPCRQAFREVREQLGCGWFVRPVIAVDEDQARLCGLLSRNRLGHG